MKLSKIYSNNKSFEEIDFQEGINVVLAEIRVPENRSKDTHNLGKTTLGRLLDFCFISTRNPQFFLFKHYDVFQDFIFFLEIKLDDESYVTVRRSVKNPSKISFKKSSLDKQDFSTLAEADWDHFDLSFERARLMLDSLLDWRSLKSYSYRQVLGYQLRSQDDYRDVFQLGKFAGAHSGWKPCLAHILGFDSNIISLHYEKEKEIDNKTALSETIKSELGGSIEDVSKIEGILFLKKQDADKKQKLLDVFDFRNQDKENTMELVDGVDEKIAALNKSRYSLHYNRKKIISALKEDQVLFEPDEAERLFNEAGVLFEGQIKKDFKQLVSFNKLITEERYVYLNEELDEIKAEISEVNSKLNTLGKRRVEILSYLSDTDVFHKYKKISDEMVIIRADIIELERQRALLERLQTLRTEIRKSNEELAQLQTQIEQDVDMQNSDENSLFSSIRLFFNEIVEFVIDQKALLSVYPNSKGHLDFKAEILDESGKSTSADRGHTYRKLLCIAFDLAVIRAHVNEKFPRFVYHDGVFESLDERKKENLLIIIREYIGHGVQSIITMIDTDVPKRTTTDEAVFSPDEIVLTLHDENINGRLFKIKAW